MEPGVYKPKSFDVTDLFLQLLGANYDCLNSATIYSSKKDLRKILKKLMRTTANINDRYYYPNKTPKSPGYSS